MNKYLSKDINYIFIFIKNTFFKNYNSIYIINLINNYKNINFKILLKKFIYHKNNNFISILNYLKKINIKKSWYFYYLFQLFKIKYNIKIKNFNNKFQNIKEIQNWKNFITTINSKIYNNKKII